MTVPGKSSRERNWVPPSAGHFDTKYGKYQSLGKRRETRAGETKTGQVNVIKALHTYNNQVLDVMVPV